CRRWAHTHGGCADVVELRDHLRSRHVGYELRGHELQRQSAARRRRDDHADHTECHGRVVEGHRHRRSRRARAGVQRKQQLAHADDRDLLTGRERSMKMHRMVASGLVASAAAVATAALVAPQPVLRARGCGLHSVAAADDIPAGHDVSESQRYPNHLMDDHLKKWGAWCEYDIAHNGTTSNTYITGGQLATTWNDRPDLITLTVGEQNTTIVNLITSCFDNVKSHDFAGASSCAGAILGNSSLYSNLTSNLTTILQQYRVIMAGRPKLVVAVTGYPNPYPKSLDATAKIAELCPPLIDTIPTCTARWVQLPPALELIDQVFQKLNTTI